MARITEQPGKLAARWLEVTLQAMGITVSLLAFVSPIAPLSSAADALIGVKNQAAAYYENVRLVYRVATELKHLDRKASRPESQTERAHDPRSRHSLRSQLSGSMALTPLRLYIYCESPATLRKDGAAPPFVLSSGKTECAPHANHDA